MQLRVSIGAAPLALLASLEAPELTRLSAEGSFLKLTLRDGASLKENLGEIEAMEGHVRDLIADNDDVDQIAALSALKTAIVGFTTDVTRESYIQEKRAAQVEDATTDQTGSHPTSTGVAAISQSSQSNGASSDQKEEISNEQEQAQPSRERKR
jgi:hypothetical protein